MHQISGHCRGQRKPAAQQTVMLGPSVMRADKIITAGNVAVVTGAASGIGRAACLHLAEHGMSVCLVDLAGEKLDAAAAEVEANSPGGPSTILKSPVDVSDPDQIRALHEEVFTCFGKVNFLMNNAVTRMGRGHQADLAEWRTAMDVNFWGVVYATRVFMPGMLAINEPGIIVNVGSKQGITNPPGHPIYNVTKSALKTYTELVEHELRSNSANTSENRVTAHLLVPGWTTTGEIAHQHGAWLPHQVIDFMCAGLARGDFYIVCPDD